MAEQTVPLYNERGVDDPNVARARSGQVTFDFLEMAVPVESQTLGKEAPVSFRKLVSHIPSTTYGVFGLYRYPAKFIPQVIAYVMERYSHPEMVAFDPFAGCGTVGLVARLYGLHYEMWDLNPMLEMLHSVAITNPVDLDVDAVVKRLLANRRQFVPAWSNLNYWFPPGTIPFLCRVWGFYHSLADSPLKRLLLIALLKATRRFSYNDPQRQKLSKSPLAKKRVESLLNGNWEGTFLSIVANELRIVLRKLKEYQNLRLAQGNTIQAIVRGGVDIIDESSTHSKSNQGWDILITSPPYLQAQEYIRSSKIDLFWLGYSEETLRHLAGKEMPYRAVSPIPIHSETYRRYHKMIAEDRMLKVYHRYFHGVLGSLTHLAPRVRSRLFLFVGPASIRTIPIPIDRIFAEHFMALGWTHEETLVDSIVSRVMFRSRANPATGLKDQRMTTERLVILTRRDDS